MTPHKVPRLNTHRRRNLLRQLPLLNQRQLHRREGKKSVSPRLLNWRKKKDESLTKILKKLLHVSDATASRYGTILVQHASLKREGKGRGVTYFPIRIL